LKFLADVGVSGATVRVLRELGHDAAHLVELGLERLSDAEILARAAREQRAVLTFDLDFGDLLAAGGGLLPSVITFRLRDQTPASVTPRLLQVIAERPGELLEGVVVSVEDAGYRVRRLPIRPTKR